MRWYQFQFRKPKRWARRAKSDGSAVPKLKRVRVRHMSHLLHHARRVTWVVFGVCVVIGLLISLYFMFAQHWFGQLFPFLYSMSAIFVVIGLSLSVQVVWPAWLLAVRIYNYRVKRRAAKRAIAHRCHLCPRCGYSLQSRTDDAQPCPECGQRISRREAVRLWARFLR